MIVVLLRDTGWGGTNRNSNNFLWRVAIIQTLHHLALDLCYVFVIVRVVNIGISFRLEFTVKNFVDFSKV